MTTNAPMKGRKAAALIAGLLVTATMGALQVRAADNARVTREDHVLAVQSIAPGYAGKYADIFLREIKLAQPAGPSKGVVLFVHGAGAPAEVAFDSPNKDYSWMAYVARAGFTAYAMDMEGYGPSQRPPAMNDPCNLPPESQKALIPRKLKAVCPASFAKPITTMDSDWNDLGAIVNYLISKNGVQQVALVGWSQGGPRTVGYALANPDKVSRLVLLAPAYDPAMPAAAPDVLTSDAPLTAQSQAEFKANWDRQAPCAGQADPGEAASVWSELIKSDPEGAKWGPGVPRAPKVPSWGFNKDAVAKLTTPVLMVSGENDKQVEPDRVRAFYADAAAPQKVFIDLACSSNNAMWEKNHLLLFQASVDWLTAGKVDGMDTGMIKKGY